MRATLCYYMDQKSITLRDSLKYKQSIFKVQMFRLYIYRNNCYAIIGLRATWERREKSKV